MDKIEAHGYFKQHKPLISSEQVDRLASMYIETFRSGETEKLIQRVKKTLDALRVDLLSTEMFEELVCLAQGDVEKAFENDPAVRERSTIVGQYPGFLAITLQRFAHRLKNNDAPEGLTRGLTEWAKRQTGIELHPGTRIGKRFFTDHGTGIVVGETAKIGDNCTLFHGVTLGNKQIPNKTQQDHKRHPTLENDVTVGAGAIVLGADTIIGAGSTIGAGIIVTKSIVAGTTVFVGKNGEIITRAPKT